jgi:hypothetical protein
MLVVSPAVVPLSLDFPHNRSCPHWLAIEGGGGVPAGAEHRSPPACFRSMVRVRH